MQVIAKENAVLDVLRRSSGGMTAAAIVEATRETKSATEGRLSRLAKLGAVERIGGLWRCVASGETEDDPADKPELWRYQLRSRSHPTIRRLG